MRIYILTPSAIVHLILRNRLGLRILSNEMLNTHSLQQQRQQQQNIHTYMPHVLGKQVFIIIDIMCVQIHLKRSKSIRPTFVPLLLVADDGFCSFCVFFSFFLPFVLLDLLGGYQSTNTPHVAIQGILPSVQTFLSAAAVIHFSVQLVIISVVSIFVSDLVSLRPFFSMNFSQLCSFFLLD